MVARRRQHRPGEKGQAPRASPRRSAETPAPAPDGDAPIPRSIAPPQPPVEIDPASERLRAVSARLIRRRSRRLRKARRHRLRISTGARYAISRAARSRSTRGSIAWLAPGRGPLSPRGVPAFGAGARASHGAGDYRQGLRDACRSTRACAGRTAARRAAPFGAAMAG